MCIVYFLMGVAVAVAGCLWVMRQVIRDVIGRRLL